MLVLTRRIDEELILRHKTTGEEIRVVICHTTKDFSGMRVRVGVDAAQVWEVLRGELLRKERSAT